MVRIRYNSIFYGSSNVFLLWVANGFAYEKSKQQQATVGAQIEVTLQFLSIFTFCGEVKKVMTHIDSKKKKSISYISVFAASYKSQTMLTKKVKLLTKQPQQP